MDITVNNILIGFGITLFAGLCTGIGSILTYFTKRTNTKFLSIALGFSAGVMLYVSMIEIFVKAKESLIGFYGKTLGSWINVIAFFGGMIVIGIIDKLVPDHSNPHEVHKVEEIDNDIDRKSEKLRHMGVFTALAIAIHNFPEGLATFTSAIKDPKLGIAIGIAIAIHNIPEGISVSIPVYYATGSKKKAFKLSFLSGLAEPIGAVSGYFILYSIFNDAIFGILFASVAGIMVFISLDELLPTAMEYEENHLAIYGLVAGMIVMAISLLMFIG